MKLTDFDLFKELLKRESGLAIGQDQIYMLESRLRPIARKWGYTSLEALTIELNAVPDKELLEDIVEAMVPHETSFFRDKVPFQLLQSKILPYFKSVRRKVIRIWCAGAASGQEPYSLAIELSELSQEFPGLKFEIFASDISRDVINQAREGRYTQFEVQRGLPVNYLLKYFTPNGSGWRINKEIRDMVYFEQINLLGRTYHLGPYDLVFCRNVISDFSVPVKTQVLEKIVKQMQEDAFLFLGKGETSLSVTDRFAPVPDTPYLFGVAGGPHVPATSNDDDDGDFSDRRVDRRQN